MASEPGGEGRSNGGGGGRGAPAAGRAAAEPHGALPLVGEMYGWLSWANQGTTRGLRKRPFDAVLLRRDRGNQEVPPGGWAAPEDHERVLRSVI